MNLILLTNILFLIACCFALYSSYNQYQKLDMDALNEEDPEVKRALLKAKAKLMPNMVLLAIGIVGNLYIIYLINTAPIWDG